MKGDVVRVYSKMRFDIKNHNAKKKQIAPNQNRSE